MNWEDKLFILRVRCRWGTDFVIDSPHTPAEEFERLYGWVANPRDLPYVSPWELLNEMEAEIKRLRSLTK